MWRNLVNLLLGIYLTLEQCAQINVVGGGNGTPGPTIKVPGGYKVSCAILAYLNPITHQIMYNRQETLAFSSILMEAASLHIKCPDLKCGPVSLASICCFVGDGEFYCHDKTIQISSMSLCGVLSYGRSTINNTFVPRIKYLPMRPGDTSNGNCYETIVLTPCTWSFERALSKRGLTASP